MSKQSLILSVCIVAGLLTSIRSQISVVQSTPAQLTFTWQLDEVEIRTAFEHGDKSVAVHFDGANTEIGTSGQPRLPATGFFVGVPQRGEVSWQFNSTDVETRTLAAPLRRIPEQMHEGAGAEARPNPWMNVIRYSHMRGVRVAYCVIAPVSYRAADNAIRILKRGSCTIRFPASRPGSKVNGSRSDFESMMQRLVINYGIASRWHKPVSRLAKTQAAAPSPLTDGSFLQFRVGDGHNGYNEGFTDENTIVCITGNDIISNLSGVSSRTSLSDIRCYAAGVGEMPVKTPGLGEIPHRATEMAAVRIDRGAIGRLDAEDTLLLYVTGASDWVFDTAQGYSSDENGFRFRLNRFTDYRCYWIKKATGGNSRSAPLLEYDNSLNSAHATFRNRIYFKQSRQMPYHWEGGIDRIWRKLTEKHDEFKERFAFPGVATGVPGRIRFGGFAAYSGEMTLRVGDSTLCSNCSSSSWFTFGSWNQKGAKTEIQFSMTGTDYYELSHFEVVYTRRLDMQNAASLEIFAPVDSAPVKYQLTGYPSKNLIILKSRNSGTDCWNVEYTFDADGNCIWTDAAPWGARYLVMERSAIASPQLGIKSSTVNTSAGRRISQLRRPGNRADYLIITDEEFADAARKLADHKVKIGRFAHPVYVYMSDVYREFSGGMVDPAGLRNFILYAAKAWSVNPEYVLLLGCGHYDYKNIFHHEEMYIPTAQFETRESQKCAEDYYACLDSGESYHAVPDIFLGRLPALSAEEAANMVSKIIQTEDPQIADMGAWRNRVLLIADDDMQGSKPDDIKNHHVSSENVAATITRNSPATDIRKVYLFEYKWDELFEKPAATQALVNEINNGVTYVNYFGHGSDVLWADEHILANDNLNRFSNKLHYPVFCSFSCNVGRFDQPGHSSMSSALVRLPDAGALACVSSTRLAYASSNEALALSFFDFLFDTTAGRSFGEAYREAMSVNLQQKSYCLLGDPALAYFKPAHRILLEIADSKGTPVDTLMALQKISVRGRVVTKDSTMLSKAADPAFGSQSQPARIQIAFFNPPDTVQRKDGGNALITKHSPYTLPGNSIFMGQSALINGSFEQELLIPQNVTFNQYGAKLTAYAWYGRSAAVGYIDSIIFHGTDTSLSGDSLGPSVAVRPVYLDDRGNPVEWKNADAAFDNEVVVTLPIKLELTVQDNSGIDLVGSAPDEGLNIEIPGALNRRNINQDFVLKSGTFTTGTASVLLDKGTMAAGHYQLHIIAQDLLDNKSLKKIDLTILEDDGAYPVHLRVFNYPNPMRVGEKTHFYFYLASGPTLYNRENNPAEIVSAVYARIKIYSLSGRLLRVLDTQEYGAENGIAWDGRDEYGSRLGPNIYLYSLDYRIEGQKMQRKEKKRTIQKLVIHPPR
ncbi:MAG: hypothetical protein GF398_21675 [Chitinivibrionales bacterium]|nr:hypothetical protein [Chitinivibrionales bacterium]